MRRWLPADRRLEFSVLPAGMTPPNPQELLASPEFAADGTVTVPNSVATGRAIAIRAPTRPPLTTRSPTFMRDAPLHSSAGPHPYGPTDSHLLPRL